MVPELSIAFMALSGIVSVALPAGVFIAWRRKYGLKIIPLFIGMAAFLLFAMMLEPILHSIVLPEDKWVMLQHSSGNSAPLVLYVIFAAGVFEETARFISFKILSRKFQGLGTALSYGIGHGGVEAMLLLGLASISNLGLMFMINAGEMAAIEASGIASETVEMFITANPFMFLVGALERVFTVTLHISLSVLVWFAVTRRDLIWLYPAAILLHAAFNIPAALMQAGLLSSITVAEMLIGIAALAVALITYYACNKFDAEEGKTGI